MSGFATGLRPFSRGSAAGESDPDTYLITFAAADTGTVNVAASGSIVNTGTGSVPWSITPPSGVTVTPSSGLSIAGTTTSLSILATAAATYSLSVTAAGATITGNSQSIVVTSSAPTIATLSGSATATITVAETYTVTLNAPADQTYTITPSASDSATLSAPTFTITAGNTTGTVNVTWPASGAGRTVDFTISPTLTRAGRPLTVGVSVLTVGAQVATLTITNESGSGSRPFAATVLPLEGEVPSGSHLSNAAGTEAGDIISTHSDGSAAVVVFASTASATGTMALHVATGTPHAALTAASIAAAGVTSVAVAFGSPYGTATISDFSTPESVWWATSKVYCARYRVAAPTPGSTALEAIIDIHAYADRALVEVVVENSAMTTATPTKPAAATYTGATVSINGGAAIVTVPSASMPTEAAHSAFRSWYAAGWAGGDPGIRVAQLNTELQRHPLLFKCDQSATFDMAGYASDAYAPWSTGRHRASGMGAGGDHPSIGPLPQWEARFLQSGDYRAAKATEASALALLGYNINYRDATTGLVPTFAELAGKTLQGGVFPSQTNVPDAMCWEVAHHPAAGLMAFVCRPSPVFIELAQKVAVWNGLWSNYGGVTTGVFGSPYQLRGRAWCMRSLAHATFLTPDALPWKAAGKTSISANVTFLDVWRTDSKALLNCMWDDLPAVPNNLYGTVGGFGQGLWQYHYLIAELHKAASARLLTGSAQTAIDTLADWCALQPVRWVNEQANGGWRYVPYVTVMGRNASTIDSAADWGAQMDYWMTDAPPAVAGTWFAHDGTQLYSDGYNSTAAAGATYTGYFWAALMAAYERGVAGSVTALATVEANVTSLSTWRAGFGGDPRWGAWPKNYVPYGFAAGSVTGGSYNAGTGLWTPETDGSGVVKALSWAEVPSNTWVRVAGSNVSALASEIATALPGWTDSNWAQLYGGTWSGLVMDYWSGSRFWFYGGGHQTSYNNGLYRFDAFKMKWAVECLPSAPAVTSGFSVGTVIFDPAMRAATRAKFDAGALAYANDIYGDEYTDGKPASRHTYGWGTFAQGENRIMWGGRRFWSYDLTTGTWDYKRVIADSISDTVPAPNGGQIDSATVSTSYGIEDGCSFWDETAGVYAAKQLGSNGFVSGYRFNWAAKTWAAAISNDGGVTPQSSFTRNGRKFVKLAQPFSSASTNSFHWTATYSLYDIDAGTTVQANATMSGFTATNFFLSTSGASFDGGALCYIASINRYWAWCKEDTAVTGRYAGLYELDPTTSPWTMTLKTTTGAVPVPANELMHKMQYLSAINAVSFSIGGNDNMFIYKF